nr:putative membrane protein [Emiliania huxleyi virus 86]
HKGYKISLQVLMGIGVYMSFMTFVFATRRRYQEYPVLVMQTNGLLWPREYGTHY